MPAVEASRDPDDASTAGPRPATLAIFYGLTFLSGAAALIYELAWTKMLALTFGSTTLSAAAVIAGFLGGMGLGAWWYHLAYARVKRPLLAYGVVEIGIAVSAGLISLTFYELPAVFAGLADAMPAGLYMPLRFVCVVTLLLVPSLLMGATFPAFCTVVIRTARGVDRHLGMVYAVNTIGAAAGVVLAGLFLIERFGLMASVRIGNAINLFVALTAFGLLRSSLGVGDARTTSATASAIPTTLPRAVTGAVLLGSGFCTLAYEILWFRAMRYVTGTSTYAFTIILFTFLVGLGLGALLLRWTARRPMPEWALAACQLGIAVLALAAMAGQVAVQSLPAFNEHVSIFSNSVRFSPWWWRLMIDVAIALVTMLPATVFMGLSFPLATRLYLGDVRKIDSRVGTAYLLANIGSIFGAVAGAALLLPMLGTIGGTKLCAALNLGLAVIILVGAGGWSLGRVAALAAAAIVTLAAALALPGALRFQSEGLETDVVGDVIFTREGDLATVQVLEHPGQPDRRAMTIDGYKIGWGKGFEGTVFYRKQVLLAHLPMVLDRRIRTTLNIGLGSAATLSALASYPQLETLDCVEINAAVVAGSALFGESAVLQDPRVHLFVDDAVHHLLQTEVRYDLIVSDGKQDPFYSGNAALLCREFYEYARARMTEQGMIVQWIPLGTLHSDFRTILQTMFAVFDEVDVFYVPPEAILLVGSSRPLRDRPRLPEELYRELPVGAQLARYFVSEAGALVSGWVAGKEQLQGMLGDAPQSTWDDLVLEFSPFVASEAEWQTSSSENLGMLLRAEVVQSAGGGPAFRPDDQAFRDSKRLLRRACLASMRDNPAQARQLAEEAMRANPADGEVPFFLERLRNATKR